MKYLIKARIEVDGRVERHDVIGAIFGQTEGLLGSEFNLEELQEKDKIGRVHVELRHQGTKTVGSVQVPSNLDRVETSILAAMLEVVERVGPYPAKITVEDIEDLRAGKLKVIIKRSREILRKLKAEEPDLREIIREVLGEPEKPLRVVEYGKDRLPAGPGVETADTVIIVEGRADVVNLVRYGYANVVALNGAHERVPETIKELAQKKRTILFVDGDRGGELILKSVLSQLDVDYVARAPEGREVESLTGKEIARALSEFKEAHEVRKMLGIVEVKPAVEAQSVEAGEAAGEQARAEAVLVEKPPIRVPKEVLDSIEGLKGTLEAVLYDESWREVGRIKVRELFPTLQEAEKGRIYAVVFDGIITQRILDAAGEKGVKLIVGARVGSGISKPPEGVAFASFSELSK